MFYLKLSKSFNKNSIYFGFVNVQCFWYWTVLNSWIVYLQEIIYFLVVNLQKGTKKLKFPLELFVLLKNSVDGAWDNPCEILIVFYLTKISHLLLIRKTFINKILPITSKHCVSLARSSLSIGKDGEIKPFKKSLYRRWKMTEHLKLRFFLPYNRIKLALNVVNLVMVYLESFVLETIK